MAQVSAVTRELKTIGLYRRIGVYQPDAPALGALAVVVMKGPRARSRLSASLDGIRADFKKQGYRPLIAGLAPANAAVDRELRRSLTLFMPLVAVVAVLIGWILFRSVRVLLAMFLPVVGVVILGVAGLEITGNSLNLVTAVMPPLVLAVSFAGAPGSPPGSTGRPALRTGPQGPRSLMLYSTSSEVPTFDGRD